MVVKQVLRDAKAVVERGWFQGDNTDGRGNYCLRAAIGLSSGRLVDFAGHLGYEVLGADASAEQRAALVSAQKLDIAASKIVVDQLPEGFDSIPLFNDNPATTKSDVLAILDKAIKSC